MKLDWKLLREQKTTLLVLAHGGKTTLQEAEHLDGVVNLIDRIQDDALDSGEATELEVFGTEKNPEDVK